MDKNNFKEVLTIIDSYKFGYKNKIGKFKYTDIKDLVNNIKDNTISEIDLKKHLNILKIKRNSKLEQRRLIPGQKELLKLFDDLSIITLTNKTLISSKMKMKMKIIIMIMRMKIKMIIIIMKIKTK